MWSKQSHLEVEQEEWPGTTIGRDPVLPLGMLWISKAFHWTKIQPIHSQNVKVCSPKCSQSTAAWQGSFSFPQLTKDIGSTWGRGIFGPAPTWQPTQQMQRPKWDALKCGRDGWAVPPEESPRDWLWRGRRSRFKCLDMARLLALLTSRLEFLNRQPPGVSRRFCCHQRPQRKKENTKTSLA